MTSSGSSFLSARCSGSYVITCREKLHKHQLRVPEGIHLYEWAAQWPTFRYSLNKSLSSKLSFLWVTLWGAQVNSWASTSDRPGGAVRPAYYPRPAESRSMTNSVTSAVTSSMTTSVSRAVSTSKRKHPTQKSHFHLKVIWKLLLLRHQRRHVTHITEVYASKHFIYVKS